MLLYLLVVLVAFPPLAWAFVRWEARTVRLGRPPLLDVSLLRGLPGYANGLLVGTLRTDDFAAALTGWLDFYNHRRPHGALSHKPPIARLHERNNLLGSYS